MSNWLYVHCVCFFPFKQYNSIEQTHKHTHNRYDIDPMQVGRLEVGTETLVDKSKSTKTILMDLFPRNTDIEGATIVNACYGGTAALLNAVSWMDSSAYDGSRYAIVVAADIATYANGPARPTCGCGAVAMLIGPDAPIQFQPKLRTTHASNTWDFYKPNPTVEYPTVDGALSQVCYYEALEDCYTRFCDKIESSMNINIIMPRSSSADSTSTSSTAKIGFNATKPDYFVFHAPYNKLVQKSYARLFYIDAYRQRQQQQQQQQQQIYETKTQTGLSQSDTNTTTTAIPDNWKEEWYTMNRHDTYNDRELESTLKQMSSTHFQQKLYHANYTSQQIGNTYTASVFFGLASLIHYQCKALQEPSPTPTTTESTDTQSSDGKQIVVFSYGSGAIATMYQLLVYV
jgi:hydroxymethylglutaryl-CoA synthase